MEDVRGEIAKLEQRIERLAESLERCRKVAVAAKMAIGLGAVLLAALIFGLVRTDVLLLMISGILLLGGIVLSERLRAALIGEIDLTLVPEPTRLLH